MHVTKQSLKSYLPYNFVFDSSQNLLYIEKHLAQFEFVYSGRNILF